MARVKKIRNSEIELLKLVAMFMVVVCHSIPYYGDSNRMSYIDIQAVTMDVSHFIIIILSYLGQLGNAIFVICSAWFLLDDNKVRGGENC